MDYNKIKKNILEGYLTDLPNLHSKIVRIFTSSTFTDTKIERDTLITRVYPKIKEFCRLNYGLDFQVVDMRWGIPEGAMDDHTTVETCVQEIDACKRLSLGPNFVLFSGQKYGYQPLSKLIKVDEFKKILTVIEKDSEEYNLLNKWYIHDENAIPSVYVLQTISKYYIHFNDKRIENKNLKDAHIDKWWNLETCGFNAIFNEKNYSTRFNELFYF
ncbi:hypothetical protein A3Q56_01719 [Intoshia linei]|uniref:DUF4062 domain-containing protein n=1 Tax=Intoshia linei TaxID=1819745 RepID=A0A177B870_9BILA|nr:hypothetical protein A3Q56_01719 [Intoshia linei]